MARFTVFLDACVLVPITPCDTLLRMAARGAFRPLWSGKVVKEALSALSEIHPALDESRFLSRFRSMDAAFPDATVNGWEPLVSAINVPDPDDRHVVAAAIRGRADAIVTENVKDFPSTVLSSFDLEVIRLDDFLLDQYDLNPRATCDIILSQVAAMTRPPVDVEELLQRLGRSGAPRFSQRIREELKKSDRGSD